MFTPKFKATAPSGSGIWTPGTQTPNTSFKNLNDIYPKVSTPTPPPPPHQPFWTPQPSPSSGRKEFRPVRFESPTLSRRYVQPRSNEGTPTVQPPWRQSTATTTTDGDSSYAAPSPRSASSTNYCDSIPSESSLLNQVGAGTSRSVADKIKTFERSSSTSALYSPSARRRQDTQPFYKPNEVNDYVIRYKCQRARPTLKSTGYQSEPEPNYDSDYSTVKYKTLDRRRLQSVSSATNVANRNHDDRFYGTMPNPIKSAQNTYKNQPGRIEDYTTGRSSVSEKERKEWWDEVMDIFNGWSWEQRAVPRVFVRFAEDVTHLDQAKLSPHYTEGNLSRALAKDTGYTSDSNLVFRKREIPKASPLSPVEQKQAYKSVQAGGEPPLYGFRKPAPERPKEFLNSAQSTNTLKRIRENSPAANSCESSNRKREANPITNHHHKQLPIQQVKYTKVHHQAKMFTPSFIQLGGKRSSASAPPRPPNRKSSCQKAASARTSPARPPRPTLVISKRHEQCFQSPEETVLGANRYATLTLRKHGRMNGTISRSKSAGAVSTLLAATKKSNATETTPRALSICRGDADVTNVAKIKRIQQQTRFHSISPTRPPGRLTTLRPTSRSPVAFGRSISKERTFAEEKKRLENSLPTGFTNFEASTNILRDPSLKSPQEVKQAVRSYATCVAHLRSKSMPRLREELKRPDVSSVSTTVRHTTCFPQAQIIDCTKAVRKSVTRAKSPRPKAVSTISLARTDSTYSVDSVPIKSVVNKSKLLASSKKVTETKSKKNSKPMKLKTITTQSNKRAEAVSKENILPQKSQNLRTNLKSPHTQTNYSARANTRTIPRSGFQTISLHQSRSLSPRRYYHMEEYNARLDDCGDEVDHSYVDDLLWQYEHGACKSYPQKAGLKDSASVRDIARPESPTPDLKSRKFSPTREIRVPQEPRSLQVSYDTTETPKTETSATCISSAERHRKFSPTREVRVPKLPPSLQPIVQRAKSPKSVRDIARPESPAVVDIPRRFSPTREVRVPQLPLSLPGTLNKTATTRDTLRDTVRDQSPTTRKFSPTREVRVPQETTRSVRSPSRRRIDNYRASGTKGTEKFDSNNVIRASSLSSADDRAKRGLYLCGELAHSATSLEQYERHSPTCRYRNNSERFTDLNRFYSTLERVGQLERATSLTSFKPIRKDGERLDFDEWRKVRNHERAEKELHYLVGKLKKDQRTKDFVFRPRDVEDVKWRKDLDFALHSKDKSVEDLRYEFEQKNMFADYEQQLRQEYDEPRDYVRPCWRRNTVADLASNLEVKIQPENDVDLMAAEELAKCQLGSRLVSTLSKDQVVKITQQLNEIYGSNAHASAEDYVITVDADTKKRTAPNALKVRCNSTMTKEDLLKPTLNKRYAKDKTTLNKTETNVNGGKMESSTKGTRSTSPVYLARETRGAVAAKNAEEYLPKPPPPPPLPKQSANKQFTTHENVTRAADAEIVHEKLKNMGADESYQKCNGSATTTKNLHQAEHSPAERVKEPKEKITQKIQYFEERQYDEPPKTIYHAREESSPDEDEVMRAIEENMKTRARKTPTATRQHRELSTSLTDLKDIFGERHTARVNFHMHSPPERPPDIADACQPRSPAREFAEVSDTWYDLGELTPNSSVEMLNAQYRSRSLSPDSQASSSYLCRVHTGDVQKITEHFENYATPHEHSRCHFFGISTLRKVRSDPELKQQRFNEVSKDALKLAPTSVEADEQAQADVTSLAHKFEKRSQSMRVTARGRGRLPQRRVISPICVRDRLMPHIDVISKTAALQDNNSKKATQRPSRPTPERRFVVERIRSQYERSLSPPATNRRHTTSIYISNSSPDIPQASTISPHLSADWIAHKYPSPTQNSYKWNGIAKSQSQRERTSTRIAKVLSRMPKRSNSSSPPRRHKTSNTTTMWNYNERADIFANQQFDPKKHQPKARYVPDGAEASERKLATSHPHCGGSCEILKSALAVSFQDDGSNPPVPPQPRGYRAESPNRYLESDVNIHFKTPVRHEYKQAMSDDELAQRQAEQMQKLYQEERRRKYLQELQDMNARRHTDNFTPTQKSPIPLNRYDDFQSDLAPKSPNTITTRTAARALYNFQGQNARELSFKKGDIIYIRRQIDRNWYEGEHNAMIGLLPVSYVEIINKETTRQQPKKPSEGQARAKYNFQAQSGIELSLNKGELVTLTRRVDENWFEGKIANRKGIFPVSYVEVLTDIGAEDIAARTVISEHASVTNLRPSLDTLRTNINNEFNLITKNGHQPPNGILKETKHHHNNNKIDALHVDTHSEPLVYRALYKYRPQNSDEMELFEGDIVHVLEICDDGWFVGTSQRTGCFGTFPGNYVERVI